MDLVKETVSYLDATHNKHEDVPLWLRHSAAANSYIESETLKKSHKEISKQYGFELQEDLMAVQGLTAMNEFEKTLQSESSEIKKLYTRKDYDDGSFAIDQLNFGLTDRILKFGPLCTKLSYLYTIGFFLSINSCIRNRKHKLILRNKHKTESYKVANVTNEDLRKTVDLAALIREQLKVNSVMAAEIVEAEKEIIKEVVINNDPFDELLKKYPLGRKPVEFIGNLTLNEYVKQQLKEHRKLENVK
jgi:hypothetical protein